MLGADDNGMNTYGAIGLAIIFDSNLALGIRTEVWHGAVLLTTNLSQLDEEQVAELEGERHAIVGLAGSIAKHHALVAGTLFFGFLTLHTAIDVGALCMDS